jgi:hypothetical protein
MASYFYSYIFIFCKFQLLSLTVIYQVNIEDKHRKGKEFFFTILNIISIILFIIGIVVKIKTSYYKEGILISNQWKIIMNYLTYEAFFDIPSMAAIIVY